MKNPLQCAAALLLLSTLNAHLSTAFAQGTAFTYQGRFYDTGCRANGNYDLTFAVFSDSNGVNQVSGTVTDYAVPITNGLFTVALDFGPGIFTGPPLWLQIGAETNGGGGVFTPLTPLQQLTPTPYAVYATSAGTAASANAASSATSADFATMAETANGVAAGSVTGAGIASGSVVKSLNGLQDAVTLSPGANISITPSGNTLTIAASGGIQSGSSNAWSLTGNAGTSPANGNFLGTTDANGLELGVYGLSGLRLDYAHQEIGFEEYLMGINITGGYWGNVVSNGVLGGTIAGGGAGITDLGLFYYYPNMVTGNYGSIGGGYGNTAGYGATVPGGYDNSAAGTGSLAAGQNATCNYNDSFVWGDGTRPAQDQGADTFNILATGGVYLYTTTGGTDVVLDNSGDLDFGTSTRQMLNLYSTSYGIGVQDYDEYFRTGDQFYWYEGGTNNSNNGNSGGGNTLMTLSTSGLTVNGMMSFASDRNLKEHFQAVDAEQVLTQVSALPISRWNYKADTTSQHIGPMAQDFYAAFGVGPDDKHITTVDEGGVALAAIQGLNRKLSDNEAEIKQLKEKAGRVDALEKQNDLLAARLNNLEAAVNALAARN